MPDILTPTSIWNNFDDSLALNAASLGVTESEGIEFEKVSFNGRMTSDGRVKIYGVFAKAKENPAKDTVLIIPDSADSIDFDVLKMFVDKGYSALMVDYRGEWDECENFTVYPEAVVYANTLKCGRRKEFCDESADKTSWYEWVAVGIYARKYLLEKTGGEEIALVGLRDGGEIAWKLAVAKKFACVIPVCAAGWLAYSGVSKYESDEQKLDNERYRFIAGIDSQAYAPYVQCPVMILCSTNDPRFDYDRAYDTFSRINAEYAGDSVITYSVQCDSSVGAMSTQNMFMFLEKYLKHRQVFIPQPVEISVGVDKEQNLYATAKLDNLGIVEDSGVFFAEDCKNSSIREWSLCTKTESVSPTEKKAYIDIYEGTATLFVIGYAKYSNGFTIWSKIAVKKISGRFKNSCAKCRVVYTSKNGTSGFCVADPRSLSVGGIFYGKETMAPLLVKKAKEISGIYSPCGITTCRMNSPRYSAVKDGVLKVDVFCDETAEMTFIIENTSDGEVYKCSQSILGGVWQTLILESKLFKTASGAALSDYSHNLRFCVSSDGKYAINNLMWL